MAYPGNPELSVQAQERVIAAFRQVISKLQEGQRQEALLGLEFVLRMDASFAPATTLHEQLSSGSEHIDLGAIISQLQAPSTDSINELLVGAVDAFNSRDFARADELVRKVLVEIPGHQEARQLLGQIEESLKVGSQAGQFLAQAREALDKNDPQEAANFVMMAQALDPHFAGIDAMLREIQAASQSVNQAAQQPEPATAPPQAATPPPPPQAETPPPQAPAPDSDAPYQTMAFDASDLPQEEGEFTFDEPPEAPVQDEISFDDGPKEGGQEFSFDDQPQGTDEGFTFEPAEEKPPQDFAFEPAEETPSEDFAFEPSGGAAEEPAQEFAFGDGDSDDDLFAVDPEPEPASASADEEFAFGSDSSDEFAFGGEEAAEPSSEGDLFGGGDAADEGDLFTDEIGGGASSTDVEALLNEGQQAYDAGAYTKAIEILSQVFATDPSNDRATQLIDAARAKQGEAAQQVEHLLLDATDAEDAGQIDKALNLVDQILAIMPDSPEAIDMKRRLDPGDGGAEPLTAIPTPPSGDTVDDLFDDVSPEVGDSQAEQPDIHLDIPDPAAKEKKVRIKKAMPIGMIAVAAAAIVVILIGVWMGSRFLANSKADQQVEALNQVLQQADQLFLDSRIDEAILLLQDYSASELDQERILRRIEKYKEAQQPPTPTPIPSYLPDAEKLLEEDKWFSAYEVVGEGLAEHPQDTGLAELKQRIITIEPDIPNVVLALTKEDYRSAEKLCRDMNSRHPGNQEVRDLLMKSLFNSALSSLRAYNLTAAETALGNLLDLNPNDEETSRILDFVYEYKSRPVDMQLEIFISSIEER